MPSFFQECRYSNVVEFVANDYPNFFKVNHYKKHKGGDDDDYDGDDFDDLSDSQPKAVLPQAASQSKSAIKKSGASRIKEEDRNSGRVVFQSGSDESGNEGNDEISPFVNPQMKSHPQLQQKGQIKINTKPARPEEKQKIITDDDLNFGGINEQEAPIAPKDSFQTYKDMNQRIQGNKPVDFAPSFMGLGRAFERSNPMADQANAPFGFYRTENSLNASNPANNTFVNNPTYPNGHPYIHNGYQANANTFQNKPQNNRMRGFGALNMGNIPDGEALNAMLKGFPNLGFALGGGNPFMNKPGAKPEMDDQKFLETANMIKLINGTAGANPYAAAAGQKIYSFHQNEAGKPEDNDQLRGNLEGSGFEHEHEYHELPSYVRGDYRMEGNMPTGMPGGMPPGMPSNLPSAYFSSKKFNFDGYFNTFEEGPFSEFGDPKKKLKQ